MAEVVLVYPKSSYIETAMKNQYPPLALLQASIFVEKEFSVKIIDQRTVKRWDRELSNAIGRDTLCVGLTALTGEMINNALDVSRFVKESSDVPVVWGGVHPTILPEQTLANEYIDIVVVGEGEYTCLELVKVLEQRGSLKNIKGIAYREGSEIIVTEPREPIIDLDKLPYADWDSLPMHKYFAQIYCSFSKS